MFLRFPMLFRFSLGPSRSTKHFTCGAFTRRYFRPVILLTLDIFFYCFNKQRPGKALQEETQVGF